MSDLSRQAGEATQKERFPIPAPETDMTAAIGAIRTAATSSVLWAIIGGFVIGALITLAAGHDPVAVYREILADMETPVSAFRKLEGWDHAFLLEGTNSYLFWDKWNESDRRWSYLQLTNTVSEEVANAWFEWAQEISEGNPSRATCKVAILDVMRQLVRLKFLESPF